MPKRWATTTIAIMLLCACAESAATRAGAAANAQPEHSAGVERLEHRLQEQDSRIAELEARLSLLEKEGREARAPQAKLAEPLRLGHAGDPWKTVAASDADRLPVVPVAPLPDERSTKLKPANTAIREQYRAALRLVNEGRWDDALPALGNFIAQYPHDELTDNARYWRGEVHYAQRHYEQAIADFQGVLARFPGSDKAPECLLKLGMSHLRLGHRAEATRYFDQVMEQYPKSDAAHAAEKESSS